MALSGDISKIKSIPTIFVVFGATGNLAIQKLFPSLFVLYKNNLLPSEIKIVAAARTNQTKQEFADILEKIINPKEKHIWGEFVDLIDYLIVDVSENKNLDKLNQFLEKVEDDFGKCTQRILYAALSPTIYKKSFENIGLNNLNLGCSKHANRAKIVIEKPFGTDFESSQELNNAINKYFDEKQIYRIDHFLGKETVQNILALRFANEILEPIWNKDYIDNVQVTMAESEGIGTRGDFYDQTGALRDVVQNHILQLIAIVTMEKLEKIEHFSFRAKRVEIINSLIKLTQNQIETETVRGQYEGYRNENNVNPNSQTETFVALKLEIENERWKNVPFYVRTGKKLTGDVTSIILTLKEKGHQVFKEFTSTPIANHITIQIKPTEGIGIRLAVKKPGLTTQIEPVDMEFCYKRSFDQPQPDAYERLLMDIILSDQTLFLGQIGPSWNFIDPIRNSWNKGKPKLVTYKQGSWGPQEADKLLLKDKRQWLAPFLTICKI